MESNRNIDGVVTLEQRDAERSRSRRRRNDETTERADSRRSAQRERQQRRRYLETVERRPWLSRPMLGVLLIAVGLNVVEMLKPRNRPTVDGRQNVVVSNVVDGCAILIYVCTMYCTLLPYSVQRNVVNELSVVALFHVQSGYSDGISVHLG